MTQATLTPNRTEIEARLLVKYEEKKAISLAEAREWMNSLPPEEFETIYDTLTTRNK